MTHFVLVLCTAPVGEAENIAEELVQKRLAACVNIMPIRSYFRWENKLSIEGEELMLIKTVEKMVDQIKLTISQLHSYQVPEIIAIPITCGTTSYLKWIAEEVGEKLD